MGFQLLYLENWKTFGIKVIIFPDTFTLFMHLFSWSVTSPSLLLPPCLSFEFLPCNALSLFFCLTLSLFFPFLNSSISLIPLLLSPQRHQAHTVYTRSVWTFCTAFLRVWRWPWVGCWRLFTRHACTLYGHRRTPTQINTQHTHTLMRAWRRGRRLSYWRGRSDMPRFTNSFTLCWILGYARAICYMDHKVQ